MKHSSSFQPASDKLQSTETLKFGSPTLGPLRVWTTFDFVWNNVDTQRALKHSLNFHVKDQYHLGYKLEHDLEKVKSFLGQLALKNNKGDFFLKADLLKQRFTAGCNHKHVCEERTSWHSTELAYDLKNETKGIKGLPVTLLWAGEYPLNDFVTIKPKLDVRDEVIMHFSWIQKFDKNLKFVWSDNINLTNVFTSPSQSAYKFGASFEFKI